MERSEAQKKADKKYRKTLVSFQMDLYPATEADIIERLADRKNTEGKATYVKRLIREDIERGNRNDD